MTRLTTYLLFILLPHLMVAQDITGTWNGILNVQGMQLRLVFNVTTTPEGIKATMDSPDQGAKDIPVSKAAFDPPKVTFEIAMAGIKYQGELKNGIIDGNFYQSGMEWPLQLTREQQEKKTTKRSQEPERPFPYYEEQVTFYNKEAGIRLSGTLTQPQKSGKYAAAILISGSGPQDRNQEILGHKSFLVIADHLTRNGYAVLRFDDRGTAMSEGDFSTATTADFATDVESAFQYLRSRDEINSNKIGLIGHSEGDMIATMVAAKNKDIHFVISMAGPALQGDSILLLQQKRISEKSGVNPELIAQNETINKAVFDMVKSTDDIEQLKSSLISYLQSAVKDLPKGAIPSGMSEHDFINLQVRQTMTPWMLYFLRYNPALDLQHVKCPILVLFGDKDLQVPAEENIPAARKALTKAKNKKVDIVTFPGLNHLFQECDTGLPSEYGTIEQTIAPVVLDEIVNWMKKRKI